MEKLSFLRQRALWITLAVLALAAAVAAIITERRFRPPVPETGRLNVPLGVEQAAIVTYGGPPVTVAPYKWGVAVNVRIAAVQPQPGTRVYDVRYIVNREGTFDLRDYLVAEDGSRLQGLPVFQFHGDPKLSKNLDARIRETEEVTVEIGGHYYQTLAALAAGWIVWLLLLLFYQRPAPPAEEPVPPPGPTLAETLRAYLRQLEAGDLDAAARARLEMLLLRRWRSELALEGTPMHHSLVAIERSPAGEGLRQVRRWLHDPHSELNSRAIAGVIAPYTADPRPTSTPQAT